MRILFLAPQPFMSQRGTPLATKMLLETLSRRGYSMDVVIYAEGYDITIDGCQFIRLPAIPGLSNIKPGFSFKKFCADLIMFPVAAARMWRHNYDLVIAVEESAYFAMVLKPFFKVPYLFDVDSSIPEQITDKFDPPRMVTRILERIEGAAARRALAAIACCQSLKRTIKDYAPQLPVQVLEDVTMLSDVEQARAPSDVPMDLPVVMYVGKLESYQGVDVLLESFRHINQEETPARLVVIGGRDDHIEASLKMAREWGLEGVVSFLGPRPFEQLGDYLSCATITVSPRTLGRNTPMKVYSYLDSGRALLATRLLTHTQVLDDQISMLVDPEPEDMAEGLKKLLQDDDLRAEMGRAARARVADEFSPAAYKSKVDRFFDAKIEPALLQPANTRNGAVP